MRELKIDSVYITYPILDGNRTLFPPDDPTDVPVVVTYQVNLMDENDLVQLNRRIVVKADLSELFDKIISEINKQEKNEIATAAVAARDKRVEDKNK